MVTAHEEGAEQPIGLYSLTLVLERTREMARAHDVRRWTRNGFFPALHLEYLGVCEEWQGQGLGSFMMMDVVSTFCLLAEKTGIPVLTLYPLNPELRPYYAERNFVPYGSGTGMVMKAETAFRLRDGG